MKGSSALFPFALSDRDFQSDRIVKSVRHPGLLPYNSDEPRPPNDGMPSSIDADCSNNTVTAGTQATDEGALIIKLQQLGKKGAYRALVSLPLL